MPKTGKASILSSTSQPSSMRPKMVCKLFRWGCRSKQIKNCERFVLGPVRKNKGKVFVSEAMRRLLKN